MMLIRSLKVWVFVLGFIAWPFCSDARAQQNPDGNETEWVTKVYPVADLVFTAPNYPFRGIDAPAATKELGSGMGGFMGGGMGGMGGAGGGVGGGGGGGGGGFFSVPTDENSLRVAQFGGGAVGGALVSREDLEELSLKRLVEAIRISIDASSWDIVGGAGTIVPLGGRLIVTQTSEVHGKIEKLLTALRAQGGARNTVTVRAWWLRLSDADYRALVGGMPAASPPPVDRKQLETLVVERAVDHGEITCFDNQTVHIISGRFRNVVSSVNPVVGQVEQDSSHADGLTELAALDTPATHQLVYDALNRKKEVTAKAESEAAATRVAADEPLQVAQVVQRSVAYQPVITKLHSGAMLELTPTRLQEENAVVLDLRSVVSQWSEQPERDIEFRDVIPLDRTTMISQRLATTLKVPLRKPVLAGGLSLEPGATAEAKGKPQLYLVVEAIDESKEEPE